MEISSWNWIPTENEIMTAQFKGYLLQYSIISEIMWIKKIILLWKYFIVIRDEFWCKTEGLYGDACKLHKYNFYDLT